MDNFEKYWMMILVPKVSYYFMFFFFFPIKADKCDSRCMPRSTVGVINLSLKVHRHFNKGDWKKLSCINPTNKTWIIKERKMV